MIVDFHTHTFPDRIAPTAIPKMQQACHSAAFTDGTVTGLKDSMKEAGIDLSVVLPVATNPAKVSSINDLSIALTEKEGLCYFGCIHPDVPDIKQELRRIAVQGLKGIKIHPVYQGANIDDDRFLKILEGAGENHLIVVMHAGDDIGFPGVVRCAPKMIRNALRQVGPVTLIAAHMGGWHNWQETAEQLADTNVYIDTAFSSGRITPIDDHYTPEELEMLSSEEFCRLIQAFGSNRVLFGTDSPWGAQKADVQRINELPLTHQQKSDIFRDNARKLLNI